MKKFLVFLLIGVCLSVITPSKFKEGVVSLVEGADRVCFVSSEKLDIEETDCVFCGDLVFSYCTLETAKTLVNDVVSNFEGVQFEFKKKTADEILDIFKAEKVYEETVEEVRLVYGFSPYYDKHITLNGETVNMQIAFKDDELIVGFPLILTGY